MDTPETLAAALLEAGAKTALVSRGVVQKGSLNIKTQARANVLSSAPVHNAHAANAITYDTKFTATAAEGEIGYDKAKRGGSLGNLLEYGSSHNSPHRDLGRALDDEEPRFEEALAEAIEHLL